MYNITGSPEPKGKCPKCGYETFLGLFHACSTASKFSEVFGFKIETRDWVKENEWYFELSPEEEHNFYKEVFKSNKI